MRNKKERLATQLRAFIKKVEDDINFKTNIYAQYDEGRKTEAVKRFEHEAWLLCQSADEMRSKQNIRRQLQKMPDLSVVEGKLKSPVMKIFDEWSKNILVQSESIQEAHLYSFWPDEKSNAQTLLKLVKELIDHSKNINEIRAARLFRTHIIDHIFMPIDKKLLRDSVIKQFLKKHGLSLVDEEVNPSEWKNIIPIVNKPGRRSVSSDRLMHYVKYLTSWFLSNPAKFYTVGQTILIIWCELAVAYCGRRICSINDILSIQENDIGIFRHTAYENTYHIILKQRPIKISKFLCEMLLCIADRRADNPKIFSINRSTIEEHLKTATLELGYDPETTPITAETFLEHPIECGLDDE